MQRRMYIVMSLGLLFFSALVGRLFYFQIVNGEDIARRAAAMRNRSVEFLEYTRGDILDRNLLPLTGENSTWAVYGFPHLILDDDKGKKIADSLMASVGQQDFQTMLHKLAAAQNTGQSMVRIASHIDRDEAEKITAQGLPGVVAAPMQKRYREDGFAVHLIGYVRNDSEARGQSGLEAVYDQILRGQTGLPELISVQDARGEAIQGLMFKLQREERQRSRVVTTIDRRIQELAEKSMNQRVKKGAVVVMDINNKEILAMASRPAFNPYDLSAAMLEQENTPFINRALEGYNPGSLFKMMVSIAAIEENTVSFGDRFDCPGFYQFDDSFTMNCWKEEGHGSITFEEAFANSCNPSFIEIGLTLGREKLNQHVKAVHLTDQQIIGYSIPSAQCYVNIDGGEKALANACLGQLGVKLSPLQIASLVSTIVDNGKWSPPVLVRYVTDQQGKQDNATRPDKQQVMQEQTAEKLQYLLKKTVADGTGKSAAISSAQVAGKTATSQTGRENEEGEEILNTWFTGYLPAQHPKWAIVVMIEEGISGSQSAAPVFREISEGILQYYSAH
ncbi:MAG: penicillin-binding protein 2 [Bacillota bacterium]|nr:penicillin-binding protein 2 [Bacillota bacterium]